MSSRTYTQEELTSLLQAAAEEVTAILLDSSPQHNQYFYENFATISLKAFKYATLILNLVSSNQRVGSIIDSIFKGLTQSMQQYKSRNIFIHSAYHHDTDPHEQDQIYHFLNTRNNQIPVDLLNSYSNEKQRLELQQFVQKIESQHRLTAKSVKRMPIPVQTHSSKSGRKTTLSTDLQTVHQQVTDDFMPAAMSNPVKSKEYRHFQIQTQNEQPFGLQQRITKNIIDNSCQYEYILSQQPASSTVFSEKRNAQKLKKVSGKKKGQDGSKSRKATFNDEASCRSKQSSYHLLKAPNENEKSISNLDSKEANSQLPQYSLKSVKANEDGNLAICQKEVHLTIQAGVQCQILAQNGVNKSTRTISRKKIATGGQLRVIKSTVKLDEDQLLLGNKDPNQHSWKPQLRKEASIFDNVNTSGEENANKDEIQSAHSENAIRKDMMNSQEDYIIIDSQQDEKQEQKHQLDSAERGTRQRVSIVNVRIANENQQHVNEEIVHSNHSQHISNFKRKTLSTSKLADSFKKIENKNNVGVSSNFKAAKRQKMDEEQKQRKERKIEKPGSLTTGSGHQSCSSTPSQDYLCSRDDPAQIVGCLAQIKKNQQSKVQVKEKQNLIKQSKSSKAQEIIKHSSHSSMGSSGDMMMIFSSKNRPFQEQSMLKTIGKEEPSSEQPSNSKQRHKRNIQTSQGKLSTIMEVDKPQECNSVSQSKFISLSKFRSNECKTVGNASRSLSKLLNRQNSQSTPFKTSLHRLQKDIFHTNNSASIFQNKSVTSASQHLNQSSFSRDQLKRKLRSRANKDKMELYLELVESTHKKFCGEDCEHIRKLLEGKDASINEQLIRLFNKIK